MLCQRGSRWRRAAVDHTFILQLSVSKEGQTRFDLFGLWINLQKEKWKRSNGIDMPALLAIYSHLKWRGVDQVLSWYKLMKPCWFPLGCMRKLASRSLTYESPNCECFCRRRQYQEILKACTAPSSRCPHWQLSAVCPAVCLAGCFFYNMPARRLGWYWGEAGCVRDSTRTCNFLRELEGKRKLKSLPRSYGTTVTLPVTRAGLTGAGSDTRLLRSPHPRSAQHETLLCDCSFTHK